MTSAFLTPTDKCELGTTTDVNIVSQDEPPPADQRSLSPGEHNIRVLLVGWQDDRTGWDWGRQEVQKSRWREGEQKVTMWFLNVFATNDYFFPPSVLLLPSSCMYPCQRCSSCGGSGEQLYRENRYLTPGRKSADCNKENSIYYTEYFQRFTVIHTVKMKLYIQMRGA